MHDERDEKWDEKKEIDGVYKDKSRMGERSSTACSAIVMGGRATCATFATRATGGDEVGGRSVEPRTDQVIVERA